MSGKTLLPAFIVMHYLSKLAVSTGKMLRVPNSRYEWNIFVIYDDLKMLLGYKPANIQSISDSDGHINLCKMI